MKGSPDNEGPIRSVPETAKEENDKGVPDNLRLGTTAATERNVHIIPEPCRQGNVPSAPELRDIPTEIRDVEIPHQIDSEELGRSYRDVRVSGEVPVNLERKEHGRQQ